MNPTSTHPLIYYFITNDADLARVAESAGVQRIMVDLEVRGKAERQHLKDTLISQHTAADVSRLREALHTADLLTRVNPLWEGSGEEVDGAVARGTDRLMLPMFRSAQELERFVRLVDGRARITGLLETRSAMDAIEDIVQVAGVDDFHVGLTDLHLELGMSFLFQCLAEGHIDRLAAHFRRAAVPFGFGGIGRVGGGMLPAELILAEHVRVGSRAVILGRVFHNNASTVRDLEAAGIDFAAEVAKLSESVRNAGSRSPEQIERDKGSVQEIVADIVQKTAAR